MSERMQSKLHIEGSAASRSLEEQQRLMEEYDTAIYESGSDDAAFEEAMQKREHEKNVAIEERIMSSPTTRRMYMMAQQIAELKAKGADVGDKEDKLEELLVAYSDDARATKESHVSNAEQERNTLKGDRVRLEKIVAAEEALVERDEEIDFILAATEGAAVDREPSLPINDSERDEVIEPTIEEAESEDETEKESDSDASEEKEATVDTEAKTVGEQAEDALVRMGERAEEMEREANEVRNNTDQAKADKELLASANEGADKKNEDISDASKLEMLDESPAVSASDLEMLDEEDTTTSRSRTRRIRDAFTPAGAAAEVSAWAATREKLSRKNRIRAVLGGAALAGALIFAKTKGLDFDNPFTIVDATPPVDDLGSKGSQKITPPPSKVPSSELVETVKVNPGDGEIKVTKALLESNGINVSAAEAQQIGEHAQVNDILRGDASYAHSGSSMDRIGKTGEFEARSGVVKKLLASAKKLGFK